MATSDRDDASKAGADITNVFVLMLENHSFDNVFAMSGIEGIRVATPADTNTWTPPEGVGERTAHVAGNAPWTMTTDPGHEFEDVVEQLTGVQVCCLPGTDPDAKVRCSDDADCYRGGTYPPIDLSGFATNYAYSRSEDTGRPATAHVPDIMACFDTRRDLPVIHQLATEFAICDAWFSSLPGPTWPNRFFVHGASSAGVAQSPHAGDEVVWETIHGFEYANGSIFHHLSEAGHEWRLYQDKHNDYSDDPSPWHQGGWISQVASLKGISLLDVHDLRGFRDDLHRRTADGSPSYRDIPYTFIEPNFGASFFAKQGDHKGPTYKGGSAQHPEDDPSGGEGLIKAVYESIRNSPVWDTSVLIVVYDEHGGFYDSVPPGPAPPPGDRVPKGHDKLNQFGFDFATFGVRVPAVVVSPLIPRGTVDHTPYDHSSVLATVERLLGMDPLTKRDAAANDVRQLLSLPEARTDCPTELVPPAERPKAAAARAADARAADARAADARAADARTAEARAGDAGASDGRAAEPAASGGPPAAGSDAPVPTNSNAAGFLHVLAKAELEGAGDDPDEHASIKDRLRGVRTMGDAADYLRTVAAKLGLHAPS